MKLLVNACGLGRSWGGRERPANCGLIRFERRRRDGVEQVAVIGEAELPIPGARLAISQSSASDTIRLPRFVGGRCVGKADVPALERISITAVSTAPLLGGLFHALLQRSKSGPPEC